MSPAIDLDRLCADALARIANSINRMAAQQARRMREGWHTAAAAATPVATPTTPTPATATATSKGTAA